MAAAKAKTNKTTKKHPMAGKTMEGAEMILQVLADEEVDTIFGYSGGAILPTYDAVYQYNKNQKKKDEIRLVVPANEQGAAFMAAGYSRASGRVGVCLVTSGPGATNCVTPIRDSMADSIPMVMICGQVPRAAIGTDAFQEAPIFNIMSACAKHVFLVEKEDQLEETIRSAFDIARSGRPGPVVIDVPKDVQQHFGKFKGEGLLKFRGFDGRKEARSKKTMSKSTADSFFKILKDSKRPLVYAGGGIIMGDASAELRKFLKKFKLPVVTTLMGISSVDTTEELSMHMLGMHGTAYANYAVEDCDFLIAIGARFDDRVAGKVGEFAPNARNIAHIDLDSAEIGKVKAVTWSHNANAKRSLTELLKFGKDVKTSFPGWHKHLKNIKKKHCLNYDRKSPLIQPAEVLIEMNNITKGDAIISTGVGQHQMFAAQYIDYKKPRTWLTSGSMGTMGFGLPAAIGAQLACPDAIVIDVDGDGSIRMNIGELETMTTYEVNVKVLLLNNTCDGMVRQWQNMMYEERYSGTDKALHKKDFIMAAKADGFEFAVRVSERKQLKKAMKAFIDFKGPAFLEVMTDIDSMIFPMVGPGKGYKEMQTGPFIVAREPEEAVEVTGTGDTAMF
ncbi:MAG TPA: biosynthetic-type acetolactate synthase large subunit [Candidatus Hydrogenedentes bacterium]|nr:biosynthetic-type acetolactate synthase large subunit [Candidatus Hydrogenedentota bacterium]